MRDDVQGLQRCADLMIPQARQASHQRVIHIPTPFPPHDWGVSLLQHALVLGNQNQQRVWLLLLAPWPGTGFPVLSGHASRAAHWSEELQQPHT